MKDVTIVIPVRNRAAYLMRLFRTLAAVSYEDLEIILVDNGSTDNSLSLCRSFAEDAPMVVTVLEESRTGAPIARNRGLEACKTEWIYFFDSDDEISSSFLTEIMPQVSDEDMVVFPTTQEVDGKRRRRSFVSSTSPAGQILSATMSTQSMLFRTDFIRSIGGWDERVGVWQDWELGIRALLHQPKILWLPDKAYHLIHIHAQSITGGSMTERLEARLQTIGIVAQEITTPTDRRALYLRHSILNGMLQREGTAPVKPNLPASPLTRMLGACLQRYTALGGRGSWRLALFFL